MATPSQPKWIVQVLGPFKPHSSKHRTRLLAQLKKIPRDIKTFCVTEDTPTDIEWTLLGKHFTSIEDLELESGWNEGWNDKNFPTHWPLRRLLISNSCSDVFTTPFVLEGRVTHLVLMLTCGLRFEGQRSDVIRAIYAQNMGCGDKESDYEDNDEIESSSEVDTEALRKRFELMNSKGPADTENQPSSERVPTKMRKLEILENDAIDTFSRMIISLPHVVESLTVLNLRSTNDCDFTEFDEQILLCMLPVLKRLDTLVLTVGEVFPEESTLENLYKYFPPNISKLRFRGTVSIAQSEEWDHWVESFASSEFLPKLKRLSFVLDMCYDNKRAGLFNNLVRAPDDVLRRSQKVCEVLHRAVEKRGLVVEPFKDMWSEKCDQFQQVDSRWIQG